MQTVKTGRDYTGYAIAKCRCGAATRVALPRTGNAHTLKVDEIVAVNGSVKLGAHRFFTNPNNEQWHLIDVFVPCVSCGARMNASAFAPIFGRFVEEHVCNGKCMNATSETCDCSCGGLNHGKGHGFVKGE